jgi:large subunit ribosomal protein L31
MKPGIHPNVQPTTFQCACGAKLETASVLGGVQSIEICSNCHPFFSGKEQKVVDAAGRIEKFKRRYQRS